MPVATKRKAKPKEVGPPPSEPRKALPINAEYEEKAKRLLRDAMQEKGWDYERLQRALAKMGVEISARGLENKISRGGFSAAFLLQCMDALAVHVIQT